MGYSRQKVILQNKKRLALFLRRQAKDRKKAQQKKSSLCTAQTRSDEDINSSKKPRKVSSTAEEQSLASPGDIVPIVFCKRSTDGPQSGAIGGVWMQPPKIKQGSYNFVGIFLYPISQGEIVSTPTASITYVGERSLTARGGTIPTLTNYYKSATTMAAAPNVCPITSGKIFCHPDAVSFISFVGKSSGDFKQFFADYLTQYNNDFDLTIGSGNTANTTFEVNGADVRIFEIISGDDRTSAYWTAQGVSASSVTFRFNSEFVSGSTFRGRTVGTIFNSFGESPGTFRNPREDNSPPGNVYWTVFGSSADDKPIAWEYGSATLNQQTNPAESATDATLGGIVKEVHMSPVADPTNFDSSYDFTDYADITFLEIQGDIYDESDPVEGEYLTTTRQLSVFIKEGIKVALYSAGTPGTTGSSHHFVDLAMHLFAINKRLVAGTTADIASPIETSNLQSLAAFHTNFGLFFNGMIEQNVNIVDFISTMAPFFFLSFVSQNGRYSLKPLLPLTSGNEIDLTAITPAATFTDSDIISGSFKKEYTPAEERRDVQISVVLQQAREDQIGLQKSTTIRFSTVSSDARVIQYDMTDCCVTGTHARKFAKLQLATRKHSTHSIEFDTPLLTSDLSITDIIKVQRLRKNNVGDDRTESDHYQITSITHSTDGTSTIGAMHFPLDGSNVAKISDDVINGSYTVN